MYEQILRYISETLLQHDMIISNPGLLHGKTGVVVFFFHYARYTGDKSYEDYAMVLMDNMQQQIQQQYTTKKGCTTCERNCKIFFPPLPADEVLQLIDDNMTPEMAKKAENAFAIHYFWGSWYP